MPTSGTAGPTAAHMKAFTSGRPTYLQMKPYTPATYIAANWRNTTRGSWITRECRVAGVRTNSKRRKVREV